MNKRALARGAALLLISGLAAGCSSQTARFGSVDDVFTASTPNQRQIIKNGSQPYPGDAPAAAPANGGYAASASRQAVTPEDYSNGSVSRGSLPPVSSKPVAAPVAQARPLDSSTTGTVPPPEPLVKQAAIAAQAKAAAGSGGWSALGGTPMTAKEGDTVASLSRRYGVPANVIMKINGIDAKSELKAGQKIVIPAYASAAPAPSPAGGAKVAETELVLKVPGDKVPVPSGAPHDKVAVLPQSPKLKEGQPAPVADASGKDQGKAPGDGKKLAAAGSYQVQDGDSLSRIARKTGVDVATLKSANGLQDGNIRIGQTLKIPAGGTATVAAAKPAKVDPVVTGAAGSGAKATPTDTVAGYTPPKKADKAIEQAAAEDKEVAPDATGIGRMRWPVRGRVIAPYGSGGGKANDGIDIAVPEGTPVKAAENGVVIYAGDGLKEFGNTVLVRHEDGLVTVYGHASSLEVTRGQKVKRGQEIARSGMSGTTDAPKLHFEVRKNSAPVDPSTYLE